VTSVLDVVIERCGLGCLPPVSKQLRAPDGFGFFVNGSADSNRESKAANKPPLERILVVLGGDHFVACGSDLLKGFPATWENHREESSEEASEL
jgi:hypothetical protein